MQEPLAPVEVAIKRATGISLSGCPDPEVLVDLAENGTQSSFAREHMAHVLACSDCFRLFETFRHVEEVRAEVQPWWEKLGLKSAAEKLMEGAQALPDWFASVLASLAPQPKLAYNYRRSTAGTPIHLEQPDMANRNLLPSELRFNWKQVDGASKYAIRLWSQDQDLTEHLIVSDEGAQLSPHATLEPGVTYRIHIQADLDPDSDWIAAPVELTCSFGILDKREEDQLNWANSNVFTAPVAAMLTFYRLQRYADALAALESCPQGGEIDTWREAIERIASERRRFSDEL
jgi:hypothetical protein